ncbi:MAG: C4-dicarboxylate ABC transporter permease [Rhodospirillales bacterium]|jgi:putative tricarboxylic transport membrane protein|nr:C4-dicarboxylate ABC transporter permease [Rhodospirillales bacterium]MBT4006069.1 C4-dicarboxylate ABC transporter permease [Rhodospirillales bacterium]MBT5075759.1 C4-dicarboxylate ABC transporter permease [Rhodospirillales bacterium]MBT5112812.1 C4-dicarboxylate ABC transporter permease [Rhodospirillales bacterium]MBT5673582.1 C4-dicarboxylate ABC transporter permease [Rhodospirillales bacterium]
MEPLLNGLSLIFLDPFNIMLIFIGVLVGVVIGALPGLSSPMAVALLLPFTIGLEPIPAIAMLASLYCAGTFGGSITAILINAPGAPPAVATAFDGYPMAKRGEAGRALGMAAVSSVCGGVFSLVIFLLATPLLAKIANQFQPADYFALAVFALSMLASISGKSSTRNLISGLAGVLIGTIGIHLTTGVERFTFGVADLTDGVHFVPVLIGLFAMGELLTQSTAANVVLERITSVVVRLPSRADLKKVRMTILRSCGIGTFIGILPAEGSTIAAIMGYNEAKRFSKNKEEFGKGAIEGIAGPEAANNAAAGGAMVPTLALGIPGSGTTAIILAALIMHGLRPGPHLMNETPHFIYAIFGAMMLANIMFLGIGLAGAKFFARITMIPRTILWPSVFVFSLIGAYAGSSSLFDVWVMLIAGLIGFVMLRHGFGPAPFVMGLILGKLIEESLSQSMIIFDNNWLMFFERPFAVGFFALTILGLFWGQFMRGLGYLRSKIGKTPLDRGD